MKPSDFAKIIKQAEKQVPVEVRAHDHLLNLRFRVETLHVALRKKEDWLELRRLSKRGKRIAIRFKDHGR